MERRWKIDAVGWQSWTLESRVLIGFGLNFRTDQVVRTVFNYNEAASSGEHGSSEWELIAWHCVEMKNSQWDVLIEGDALNLFRIQSPLESLESRGLDGLECRCSSRSSHENHRGVAWESHEWKSGRSNESKGSTEKGSYEDRLGIAWESLSRIAWKSHEDRLRTAWGSPLCESLRSDQRTSRWMRNSVLIATSSADCHCKAAFDGGEIDTTLCTRK